MVVRCEVDPPLDHRQCQLGGGWCEGGASNEMCDDHGLLVDSCLADFLDDHIRRCSRWGMSSMTLSEYDVSTESLTCRDEA